MGKTICVDIDDTVCDRNNLPIAGAKEVLLRLRQAGHRIVFSSARLDPALWGDALPGRIQAVKDWLTKSGIPFDAVVSHKPSADIYIDDKGFHFTGDWLAAESQIAARLGHLRIK